MTLEIFFAVDEVFTAGQPIGLIIADTEARAHAGARAVLVEYEDLPQILSIEDAIEQNSFFPHYRFIRSGGNMDEAFASADHVFEGVARMGGQEHFYLETQASIVVPKPEDGEMEVFSSTQNPTETQTIVAQVTGVPANRVVVRVKRLGGGFGGKETRSMQLTGILAVGANKAKAPVRCMLNRDEDIITSGQRHPFLGRWKVGVSKRGEVVGVGCGYFCQRRMVSRSQRRCRRTSIISHRRSVQNPKRPCARTHLQDQYRFQHCLPRLRWPTRNVHLRIHDVRSR